MKKVYEVALKELGTYEWAEGSNPKVDAYFDEVGYPTFTDDTAWCAAFVGAMLKRAGFPHTGKLNARSYLDWGNPVELDNAEVGDVVILWRNTRNSWQGHVGFYVDSDGKDVTLIGGNQNNQVNEQTYPRDRVLGVRRMKHKSMASSKTMQASIGQVAAGAGTVGGAIGALDGQAQIVALVLGAVIVLAALIIMADRWTDWRG